MSLRKMGLSCLAALSLFVAAACGGETVESEVAVSAFNVQFLAADGPIAFGAEWPNTPERALLVGEELDCVDAALLSESVSDAARDLILEGLTSNDCDMFSHDSWEFVTLKHDFGIVEDLLAAPEIAEILTAYAAKEAFSLSDEEAAVLGFACEAGGGVAVASAVGVPPEIVTAACSLIKGGLGLGDAVPVIDEEVAIATRWPIVSFAQLEFSQGSGIDRLAAKGALLAHVHVPTTGDTTDDPRTTGSSTDSEECGQLGCLPSVTVVAPSPTSRPNGGLTIAYVVTHLDTSSEARNTQIAELVDFIEREVGSSTPLIIGGDFNIRPTAPSIVPTGRPSELDESIELNSEYVDLIDSLQAVRPDLSTIITMPTNKQGWNRDQGRPCLVTELEAGDCTGGAIDHFFFSDDFVNDSDPDVLRDFHPVGVDNAAVLIQLQDDDLNETLSDHAEVRLQAQVEIPTYSDIASLTTDRVVSVDFGTLFIDDDEGLCGVVDPQMWAELWIGGEKVDELMAGPASDNRRLSIDDTLSGEIPAGQHEAELRITEVSDDDDFLCEGDTVYDITRTNTNGTARFYLDTSTRFGVWEVDDDGRFSPFGQFEGWEKTSNGRHSLTMRFSVRASR